MRLEAPRVMLKGFIYNMAVYCCVGAIICFTIQIIICRVKHRKYAFRKDFSALLFVSYCVGLVSQTIPIHTILRYGTLRMNGMYRSINLIPFNTISEYVVQGGSIAGISLANVLGNILLFVPMGVLLPIVFQKCDKWCKTVLIGAVVSTAIECVQYFFARSADIDDVILNTLGTAVGFLIYKAFMRLKTCNG